MKKRILSVILSLFIIFGVILADYERVQAVDLPTAFWGTLEASRAWFTAMQAGGAFDRGISFNQFVNTTSSQWQEVQRKTMEAFKLYLYYRYQIDITEKFPNMTIEEVRNEAIRLGTITYNSFVEKAINVSNTTKEGISVQDFKYWQDFCKEFSSVAKNGLGQESIGPTSIINTPLKNDTGVVFTSNILKNVGANTFDYDGNFYIDKGQYYNFNSSNNTTDYQVGNVPSDRVAMPFVTITQTSSGYYFHLFLSEVNRLNKNVIYLGIDRTIYNYSGAGIEDVNNFISNTNLPIYITADGSGNAATNFANEYVNNLAVSQGSGQALDWQYEIDDSLENTAGQSIKDGNIKQSTKTVVKEGSVPVKRSSLKEEERNGEKVVSGEIGWDIPGTKTITAPIVDDTKEDEFIEDIGIIDVPEDIVIDDPVPGEIVIPGEEEVVIPVNPDVPIPIIKILEIQYGPFYPTAMEGLEEFFPFCIPFDIAYCVNKFRVGEGEAPVLNIPIVYPRALQGVLGQSYNVTIDFNDYIALRNIIRYFILILFIVGLMTLTRNIIRG